MIAINRINSKKPIKRQTLEAIAEEKELETVTKNSLRVVPKSGSISKTPAISFTPFFSSWGGSSIKTQKSVTTDIASKGNFRQYESLKTDYKELLEYTRLEEIKKQAIISRVEELENECLKLQCQAEENKQMLALERKNAEQMKTDYEFTVEIQNQVFKRREKELLERIDKCAETIDIDKLKSTKTDLQSPAMNIFEYEEISEKLESFEKQNKYLQSSNEVLELQNRLLKYTLAEMKVSVSSLELQNNELKVGNNLNRLNSSSIVNDSEKQPLGMNFSKDFETQQQYLPANNEIIQMLHDLQNMVQLKSENKGLTNTCCSRLGSLEPIPEVKKENSSKYRGGSDNDILNLLHICLAQINSMYRIENRYTENGIIVQMENNSLEDLNEITLESDNKINSIKQFGENDINMSDAEKIINSNVFMESAERSVVESSELITQNLKLRHETDTELQEIYENSHKTLSKKNMEIKALLQKNGNLLETIETLNQEKYSREMEYERISNLLLEREKIIQSIRSEQKQLETEKENSLKKINQLNSLINGQNDELQELCNLLSNITTKIEKKTEIEDQRKHIKVNEHLEFPVGQRNILEIEGHIKNYAHEFDGLIYTLKEKLIGLKYENETLKCAISKIYKYVRDMKIIFKNYKQINVKEILQQIQTLKSDILEVKNGFDQAIKFLHKDIREKNELADELQKKIKNLVDTDDNLKLTTEKTDLMTIMKDDNFEIMERTFKNDIKELDDDMIFQDGSEMNIKEVTKLQNWNFNIEGESGRRKIQNSGQERHNELAMTDENKKEDKWKLLRTREHDSRRNIDLNTLCSETIDTCNNCENVNSLNQKLKTEVAKIRNRLETRNINQLRE